MPRSSSDLRIRGRLPGFLPAQSDQVSRAQLCRSWVEFYGGPPPKGLSTRLLALAVKYHAQAARSGGLKPAVRKRLLAWAAARTAPDAPPPTPRAGSSAVAGTRLIRQWQGKAHIVDIRADGAIYQGRTYRSLSAVAKAITGAHWSGPRFFGL